MIRILRAADRRRIPWRNGGGEAEDIAVEPPGASWDGMAWRIGRAWIAASGPFSSFPGIDRTFLVVEGDGVELSPAGLPPVRLDPSQPPYRFPGDVATGCRLLGGPVVAFNVMSDRGAWRHTLVRRSWSGAMELAGTAGGTVAVLLRGTAAVRGADDRLGPLDALRLDGGDSVTLDAAVESSIALVEFRNDR